MQGDVEAYKRAYLNDELDRYEGGWVVFFEGKLVGAGGNIREMIEDVWKKHGKSAVPFVAKVPRPGLRALGRVWAVG